MTHYTYLSLKSQMYTCKLVTPETDKIQRKSESVAVSVCLPKSKDRAPGQQILTALTRKEGLALNP
jgi:hypothetical protein